MTISWQIEKHGFCHPQRSCEIEEIHDKNKGEIHRQGKGETSYTFNKL